MVAVKQWVVSRIDTQQRWPVIDSVWVFQDEAAAYMLKTKPAGTKRCEYPLYFLGLKLVDDIQDSASGHVPRPHSTAPSSL